jgi:hypothetical protein
MSDHLVSRDTLYQRFDDCSDGRGLGGAWAAHEAVVDRLAVNRRMAEARGWTSCALERAGGMGRLTVWGVPPGDCERHPIPDWLAPGSE